MDCVFFLLVSPYQNCFPLNKEQPLAELYNVLFEKTILETVSLECVGLSTEEGRSPQNGIRVSLCPSNQPTWVPRKQKNADLPEANRPFDLLFPPFWSITKGDHLLLPDPQGASK